LSVEEVRGTGSASDLQTVRLKPYKLAADPLAARIKYIEQVKVYITGKIEGGRELEVEIPKKDVVRAAPSSVIASTLSNLLKDIDDKRLLLRVETEALNFLTEKDVLRSRYRVDRQLVDAFNRLNVDVALEETPVGKELIYRITGPDGKTYHMVVGVSGKIVPKKITIACDKCSDTILWATLAKSYPHLISALTGADPDHITSLTSKIFNVGGGSVPPETLIALAQTTLATMSRVIEVKVKEDPRIADAVETYYNEPEKLADMGFAVPVTIPIPGKDSDAIRVIEWTEDMEVLREKLLKLRRSLAERMGLSLDSTEWTHILTFAAVASSDFTKPPVVLHAVGDIGSFKTTGARMLASHLAENELHITYKGPDIVERYREILDLIEEYFGVPASELENTVGGIITTTRTTEETLTVGLSIPYIVSVLKNTGETSGTLRKFMDELRARGFNVRVRERKITTRVVDPAILTNIDDYRVKYLPDRHLTLLTVMDVFDSRVLLIDEGSRNPHGLETLLTKMSLSSYTEGVRIIIITDNIEPFQEVMSNPRYAPLHDRTFKALTTPIKDDIKTFKAYGKPADEKITLLELQKANNYIENLEFPAGLYFIVKALALALEYKFRPLNVAETVYVRPIKRHEDAPVTIDVFEGIEFRFISGGRFLPHTFMLSKFNAFMEHHEHVEVEDVKKALMYTLKSRVVVEAETYAEYRLAVEKVMIRVSEILAKAEDYIDKAINFVDSLRIDPDNAATRHAETILNNEDPFTLALYVTALEQLVARGELDPAKLPKPLLYTLIEMVIERGDLELLSRMPEDDVKKIFEYREGEVK